MSDVREGDLIEATKGETVIRGRLRDGGIPNGGRPILALTLGLKSDLLHLKANGYTVTVIERAPEPLPTTPGHYVSAEHPERDSITLDGDGKTWFKRGLEPMHSEDVRVRMPLTRLRPEAETAREVIEQIANVWEFGPPATVAAWMREVGEKFGVTS